jgi:hypothetical protein
MVIDIGRVIIWVVGFIFALSGVLTELWQGTVLGCVLIMSATLWTWSDRRDNIINLFVDKHDEVTEEIIDD